MIREFKLWLMKIVGVNSPSKMFGAGSHWQTDFYNVLTIREACVLASAMNQSIDKYKDLYNDTKTDHYKNPRTLNKLGVKPEEVE